MKPAIAAVALAAAACQAGAPGPAKLDTRNDACAHCRMVVSDPRFASQLVAPREEPRFFDDLGCLRDFLRAQPGLPRGAVAYVADHRTGAWVRAAVAVYARAPGLATPMASQLVAHQDPGSREADRVAAGATPISAGELFGPRGAPDGGP